MLYEHEILRNDGDCDVVDIEIEACVVSYFRPWFSDEITEIECDIDSISYDGYEVSEEELVLLIGKEAAHRYIDGALKQVEEDYDPASEYYDEDR